MRLALLVHALLLRVYPAEFRGRFASPMQQAFRDRCRAAAARGRLPACGAALAALADAVVNAVLIRFAAREKTAMNWPSLWGDVRYAARMFARNPVFTCLAVSALALGIGANAAIFTIFDGVLLRPLPYKDPGRLVMLWSSNTAEQREHDGVAPLDFLDFRKAGSFTDLQATYGFVVGTSLSMPAGAEQILVTAVTPGMFELLGRAPEIGRTFTPAETDTAVVVSHDFWQRRLGGDPSVLGRVLTIQDHPRTVVGVMPPDFVFPYKTMLGPIGMSRSSEIDAWLPLAFVAADTRVTGAASLTRAARFLSVVGRLKPGVTAAQADGEVRGIAAQLAASYPSTNRVVGATVVPLHDQAVGALRPALMLLLGGVGFVLLMACVNLANLLLARSSAREREMAIRAALGAARRRLVRQTLVETLLLSMAGGVVALAAVGWGMRGLIALAPGDMPRLGEVHPNAAVFTFAFALSILCGLAIGLVPAYAVSRPRVQARLKDHARGAAAGRGQRRLRTALVAAEVALAVVLTLGAGLLLRSFLAVLAIDPGFSPDHLLTLQVAMPSKYSTPDRLRAAYTDLFIRLESIPGVAAVGGTTRLPLGSTNVSTKVEVEGHPLPPGERPDVEFRRAMRDYFTAMRIPLLRGRLFNAEDGPGAPTTVVINERMARKLFPAEDPIGRHVRLGSPTAPWATVVGIIGDVRHSALEDAPAPELYVWYLQNPPVNPFIVIRASSDASSLASQVRAQVQAVDNEIVAYDVRPMTQVRAESVAQRRFVLLLVGAFGVLALLMAAIGVYGVMALVVSERRPEIGIRLALGATPGAVLRGVMREGLLLAGVGVVAGFLAALLLVPVLGTQLFGVRPFDPATMAGVPLLLMTVALLACVVPARRAMSTDPIEALRD